jgi:hypothetical protein
LRAEKLAERSPQKELVSMDDAKVVALKELLKNHGTELFEQPQRCEGLLKDTPLSAPEVAAMMGALREGVPQALLARTEPVISAATIAKLADRVSEARALKYEAAYQGVELWAVTLGRDFVKAAPPQPAPPPIPPSGGYQPAPATPPVPSGPPKSWFNLVIAPWNPVVSLDQAKALTTTGVVALAIIAALSLLATAALGAIGVIFALVYAACAVGTFFKSRVAAGVGLAFYVGNLLFALADEPSAVLVMLIVGVVLTLGCLAGLRGTLAMQTLGKP